MGKNGLLYRLQRRLLLAGANPADGGALATTSSTLPRSCARRQNTREGSGPCDPHFQALRIHINQELADLEAGLEAAYELLQVEAASW